MCFDAGFRQSCISDITDVIIKKINRGEENYEIYYRAACPKSAMLTYDIR